jgi:hypothetical protein
MKIDPRWIGRKKRMRDWALRNGVAIPKGFRINPVNGSANKELMRRIQSKAYGPGAANGKWQTRMDSLLRPPLTIGERALGVMRKEIGVKEHPAGSNSGPRVSQYQAVTGAYHAPWCASAMAWAFKQVGKNLTGFNTAYVPSYVAAARKGQHSLSVVSRDHARPGDLVTFDWGHDGVADHIGILSTSVDAGGGFKSIEGNTSVGNDSNGGEVMLRDRNVSSVAAFIRVAN